MATELPSSYNSDAWQLVGRTTGDLKPWWGKTELRLFTYSPELGRGELLAVVRLLKAFAFGRWCVALGCCLKKDPARWDETGACCWRACGELLQLIFKRIWSP